MTSDFAPPRKGIESRQKNEWLNQITLVVFGSICRLLVRHRSGRNPLRLKLSIHFFSVNTSRFSIPARRARASDCSTPWPHRCRTSRDFYQQDDDVFPAPYYNPGSASSKYWMSECKLAILIVRRIVCTVESFRACLCKTATCFRVSLYSCSALSKRCCRNEG